MSLDRLIQSNAELQYPSVKPELDLNLTRKTLKGIDPAYSFTRNSSATYIGPDGLIKTAGINQPRFEYDLDTGEYKGLLIEESRTNLFTQSNGNFSSYINGVSVISADTTILAPDGTTTATRYTPVSPSSFGEHSLSWESGARCPTLNHNEYYIGSYFVKPDDEYTLLHLFGPRVTNHFTQHELWYKNAFGRQAGKVYNRDSTNESSSAFAIPYPNGWYRIYYRVYLSGSSTYTFRSGMSFKNLSNQFSWTVTNPREGRLWTWGWQLEKGDFPSVTSHIPTSGSAVTRQPDQLVLNKTLNTQGTFFIESRRTTGVSISADNGTESLTLAPPVNQNTKSVLYYNTNRTLLMSSGNNTPVETNTNPPQDLNRISLGFDRRTNGSYMNGHIKKFSYYSSPLTEDNLRALTDNNETINRDN